MCSRVILGWTLSLLHHQLQTQQETFRHTGTTSAMSKSKCQSVDKNIQVKDFCLMVFWFWLYWIFVNLSFSMMKWRSHTDGCHIQQWLKICIAAKWHALHWLKKAFSYWRGELIDVILQCKVKGHGWKWTRDSGTITRPTLKKRGGQISYATHQSIALLQRAESLA